MDIRKHLIKDNIAKNDSYTYSTDHFAFHIMRNELFIIKSIYGWATDFNKSYMETNYDKLDIDRICLIIKNRPELLIKQLKLTNTYLNERYLDHQDVYKDILDDFNQVYEDLLIFI